MKTSFMLLAQFEQTIIPLFDICETYFGCSYRTAMNKANLGQLPITVFKLAESAKAPYYVHLIDLANFIDEQREKAKQEFAKVSYH
ncbi:pyocin activator PrtN family protein [Pseudoalteromonas issachenkonii]|mgnify:CR=1 FL=1|uniref:Pyocin activator PrtN family protein n=1 Tax=Pseudoalteromonas issachenkonii TaxID=152297 RepID=A0ABU9H1R8_9GAMM